MAENRTSEKLSLVKNTSNSYSMSTARKGVRRSKKMIVKLPDKRKIVVRFWAGYGEPLVLLHGFLDNAQGWNKLALASHRPCYAFDLPGFGDSDCPTRNRISAYAEDVIAVLSKLELEHFTLVGHSFGGAVATSVAEKTPTQVGALVMIAPAGFGRLMLAELANLPLIKEITRYSLPIALSNSLTAGAVYRVLVANGQAPEATMLASLRKHSSNRHGAECAHEALVASGHSHNAFHKRQIDYPGPVCILYGDRDRLVPKGHLDGMKNAFPGAKVTVWHMGHHPQRERPEELARYISVACHKARSARIKARHVKHKQKTAV